MGIGDGHHNGGAELRGGLVCSTMLSITTPLTRCFAPPDGPELNRQEAGAV